jgi:hypothetical protein
LVNNITFYVYKEIIWQSIQDTPCILPLVVEAYKEIAHFKARRHHIYIQAKRDPNQQWMMTRYRLEKL